MSIKGKVLWLDTETTGIDPKINSVIQIAGLIEIDGEIVNEFNLNCRPADDDPISHEALIVNQHTEAEIRTFPTMRETYAAIIAIFAKHIDKYDKGDKFIVAGQKVDFDIQFLEGLFLRNGDKYMGSYLDYRRRIDLMDITKFLKAVGLIDVPDVKLETIAKYFSVPIEAHDALSDIRATRACMNAIVERLSFKAMEAV